MTQVVERKIGPRRAWSLRRGPASRLQRCSGSAATEQDLCKTVTAASKVKWATTLDCVIKAVGAQVVERAGKKRKMFYGVRDSFQADVLGSWYKPVNFGPRRGRPGAIEDDRHRHASSDQC